MSVSFTPGDKTFYAYDRAAPEDDRILDACHIYDVARVADRDRRSEVEVVWTDDGLKAALLINDDALLADFDLG